jgi:hypothetical protein
MTEDPTHANSLAISGSYVRDLHQASSFYVERLGLEARGEGVPGCMLGPGDAWFYLEPGREPDPGSRKLTDADGISLDRPGIHEQAAPRIHGKMNG